MLAQTNIDRSNYALLWEISGNGLEKPSYLFGSMHIRQDFAFEFPDSLLICLKKCEAFANEVHLDSATYRMLNVFYGDAVLAIDSNYLAFIKTKKIQVDSAYLSTRKKGKLIDFLEKSDEDSLVLESISKMPAMLDAYLMNIARGFGKELYGLENIDNHLYESDGKENSGFNFSLFGSSYKDLQKYYYAGDIAAIQTIIQKEAHSFDNLDLIARNYIMVESMLRIMEQQNLFSTIGAAHLPGKQGVIQLLRDQGYALRRVQPVFNQRSVVLQSINIEQLTKKRPWLKVAIDRPRFKLATPLPYVLKKIDPHESTFLQVDIGRGLFYTVVTRSLTPYDYNDFDEYFIEDDGYEIISKSPITHLGMDGYEYELSKSYEEVSAYKAYAFINNGELYYLQIGAYDEVTFDQTADPLFFLKRFSVDASFPDKWQIIDEPKGGFAANLPRHFTYRKSSRESSWTSFDTYTYTAGFGDNLTQVSLQYTDFPIDVQERNDSLQLVLELELIEERLGIELEVKTRDQNNYGKQWMFEGKFPYESLFVKGHLQSRGNRIYAWFSIDKSNFQQTKKFLQGFHLHNYGSTKDQKRVYVADSLFQCFIPEGATQSQYKSYPIDHHHTAFDHTYFATSTDSYSGANFTIETRRLHPLFGTTDTIAFLNDKVNELIGDGDLIISEMSLYHNQYPQILVLAKDSSYRYEAKHQLYLKNNYLILKTVFADSNYFKTAACLSFFGDDIWSKNNSDNPSSLISKGDSILHLLALQDTTTWPVLKKAIDTKYSFENKHFEPLLEIISKTNWSNSRLSRILQRKLLISLFFLDKENIVGSMKYLFRKMPPGHFLRKEILITLLSEESNNKQLNFDAFFELIGEDESFYQNTTSNVFDYFYSNILLFEQNIENIKRCLETGKDPIQIWELSVLLYKNSTKGTIAVRSILNTFLKRGKERLRDYYQHPNEDNKKNSQNSPPLHVLDFYHLFLDNEEVKKQISFFLSQKTINTFTVELFDIALEATIEVSKKKKRKLLGHPNLWLAMIKILNKNHLLGGISEKYYQKENIAQALLKAELKVNNITASSFVLEGEFEISSQEDKNIFYLFTFSVDGRPSRLGAVGLFSKNKKEFHFIDANNIVYTTFPIVKRRRLNKAKELVAELRNENGTKK